MPKKPSTPSGKLDNETEEIDGLDFDVDVQLAEEDIKLNKQLATELNMELAGMGGDIIESKLLGHNLLGKVVVEKNNLGNREGIYLILKIQGESPIIFGNKHADKLDSETIDITYQAINSTEQFLEMGTEYKEGMDMEQQVRIEKLRKELFTISGIIKKYRFLGHNLLALVKIDKQLQEMAFGEEKTDPKRLQTAFIKKGVQIDCIEGLRNGIYAVLSKGGIGMKILGGKDAYQLDPEIAETIYESIQNPAHFFDADSKLKQYLKDLETDIAQEIEEQAQHLQKIIDELDNPITLEDKIPNIPKGKAEEELDKLNTDLDELKNGENND